METETPENCPKETEEDPSAIQPLPTPNTDSPCSENSLGLDGISQKSEKPTPKNVLLAKKRLLAYSKQSQFSQLANIKKEDRGDKSDGASTPDSTSRKSRKEMYPDEKAKAVIQEIEAMKREEEELLLARSRSPSLDKQHFKKRDIKCRNFRSMRRSPSNEDRAKSRTITPPPRAEIKSEPKVHYPKDWEEYEKMKLTVKKDKELKEKTFKLKTVQKNLINRFYNFESPSLPIEPYRYFNEKGKEEFVPIHYLRTTISKPNINYSINFHMNKSCFLTRKELFNIVSEERQQFIVKLIHASNAESEQNGVKCETRSWYPKTWRNDVKMGETSVGLSFLQTYSDEEDDLEEGEIVCKEKHEEKQQNNVALLTEAKKILEEELKSDKSQNGDIHIEIDETRRTIEELEKVLMLKDEEKSAEDSNKQTEDGLLSETDSESKKIVRKKRKKKLSKHRKEKKKRRNSKSGTEMDESRSSKEKSHERSLKSHEKSDSKHKSEVKVKHAHKSRRKSTEKRHSQPQRDKESRGKSVEMVKVKEEPKSHEDLKKSEKSSPDTEEYHSHWESDDDLPPVPREKMNVSWESDEEIFERGYHSTPKPAYDGPLNLEIPLNINFSRRNPPKEEQIDDVMETNKSEHKKRRETKWDKKPMDDEMELLKRERQNLNEERRKLEIQKMRIKELELNSIKEVEERISNFSWLNDDAPPLPVDLNLVKKEKFDDDFNILENSLQSVSSTELRSNTSATLENEYEEFLKAVTTTPPKKKQKTVSTSTESESSTSESDEEEEIKSRSHKKRKLDVVDLDDLFPKLEDVEKDEEEMKKSESSANLDIQQLILTVPPPPPPPLPPQPVPVPEVSTNALEECEKIEEKPFVFTSMVLPTKKQLLVNSKVDLDDEECEKTVITIEKTEIEEEKIKRDDDKKSTRREKERKDEKSRKIARKSSPKRHRGASPSRRRSPVSNRRSNRRRSPFIRRHYSPRRRSRSKSPNRRRYSISPPPSRRKSNRRSLTPDRHHHKSPINSPLDTLKRSVADSTISDDLLAQTNDYDSPNVQNDSPKRVPLDVRINEVLGIREEPMNEPSYSYPYPSYQYPPPYTHYPMVQQQTKPPNTTKVVQMGNMLQIVPIEEFPQSQQAPIQQANHHHQQPQQQKIVQVGNMLQIVPGQLPPEPQLNECLGDGLKEGNKQSAETALKLKQAERRAEREKRRQEREKRRKEKEKRRKEKEKQKQLKLQIRTENMIKKALQMDSEEGDLNLLEEDGENVMDTTQWPTPPIIVTNLTNPLKEAGKSILLKGNYNKCERKCVQFADGVRPGEGTSPSGGEELSSPPPAKRKLPKEKRYKKKKKKIKVKVIKERRPMVNNSDEEEDNLPPPPPPPGSPPPHLFPPRVKHHPINNIYPTSFLPNMVRLPPPSSTTGGNIPPQAIYRPAPMSVIMPPPPPHQLAPLHGGSTGRTSNSQDPRHHSQISSHHFNH